MHWRRHWSLGGANIQFTKNDPGIKVKRYQEYRPYTRLDFKHACAYCFRHEIDAGDDEHFDQDHFKPLSQPGVDPRDYSNLYWSCKGCNQWPNKLAIWPLSHEQEAGFVFCDPCHHDPVGRDYEIQPDGKLQPLSNAGSYTIRHLHLNERDGLVDLRKVANELRPAYLQKLERLAKAVDWLDSWVATYPDDEEGQTLKATIGSLISEYEKAVTREPFIVSARAAPPEIPDELIRFVYTM